VEVLRDRVIAVPSPGVAAQEPADGEIETLDGSVLLDGFYGILGTGGREAAAGRFQRGDESLVEADGEDEDTAHSSFFILR